MNNLGRLLYAWNMHRKEGILIDDAREFARLRDEACIKGDAKFFRDLAAEIERQNERRSIYDPEALPYFPETALKKVRLAYMAVTLEKFREAFGTCHPGLNSVPEIKMTWSDVKETASDLYDLKLTPRQWRRLRKEAGFSQLPNPPRGRAKKRGH